MSYVKQILLPNEQVLYDGRVHPIVLAPCLLWLLAAVIIVMAGHSANNGHSYFLGFAYHMAEMFPSLSGTYSTLARWQQASPALSPGVKILALLVTLGGVSRFMKGYVLMQSIELVVTNQRVIAKRGIMTIITAEMNRGRIAEVVVDQSVLGRMLGYGHIFIRGFTGTIGGLPVMINPHQLEQYILH